MIKVGISSWTDASLVRSGWYPKDARTAEARLRYYASRFPIVENDSTYYAIPPQQNALRWIERTPDGFTMNIKAFATLTDHYTDPHRLPRDLGDALPIDVRRKPRVYPKEMSEDLKREIAARFRESIEPLHHAGKLGVVLFQYPVWFPASPQNQKSLARVRSILGALPIAIEFRNATWMSDRNRERTLATLRDHDLAYVSVDEPQGFPSSVPPIAEATSDIAIVRMHGRARELWEAQKESARERFRYRYTRDELREWVPRIEKLARRAKEVHVILNNCYSDYSVTNAEELRDLLGVASAPTREAAFE